MGSSLSRNTPALVRKLPSSAEFLNRAQLPSKLDSAVLLSNSELQPTLNQRPDGADLVGFADRLRTIGHVERRNYFEGRQARSPASRNLSSVFASRFRLQEVAMRNKGRQSSSVDPGEVLMSIESIARAIKLREQGVEDDEIEDHLQLRRGSLESLGPSGMLTSV